MSKYKIYQHLNKDNECIYVGMTKTMESRQQKHLKQSVHRQYIASILVADALNKTAMRLYEQYYINKLMPEHNIKDKRGDDVSFLKLDLLEFKPYSMPVVNKRGARIKKKRVEYLTNEQLKIFINTFEGRTRTSHRNKLFFEMLIFYKIRPNDLHIIQWGDINKTYENWTITIRDKEIKFEEVLKKKLLKLKQMYSLDDTCFIFKPVSKETAVELRYI